MTFIAERLARRVRGVPLPSDVEYVGTPMNTALHEYLAQHLGSGETHYTTRPGMTPLRRRIATRLAELGAPSRSEGGVVVTASEGESLYVALLSLEVGPGAVVAGDDPGSHKALFDLLEIDVVPSSDPRAQGAAAAFTFLGAVRAVPNGSEARHIVAIGGALGRGADDGHLADLPDDAIIIGDLNAIAGLEHFHVGFAAGPPERIKRVMTWKQALSICTAAPSQRAALRALGDDSF